MLLVHERDGEGEPSRVLLCLSNMTSGDLMARFLAEVGELSPDEDFADALCEWACSAGVAEELEWEGL